MLVGSSIRVYLAASFSRQAEMQLIAARLQHVTVVSRWLYENQGMKHGNSKRKFMMRCALTDIEDIRNCDIFVRFSDDLSEPTIPSHLGTGARHFEDGLAYALGKQIIVVGGHQNVFDFLPCKTHVKDVDALVHYLSPEEIN